MLRERLQQVEERIGNAAARAGRKRSEITLVAVTKKFSAQVMREAYHLGLRVFGENYVQEFEDKWPALQDLTGVEYHLIGHLQSNKAKIAADLFQAIDTVDSAKLARRLEVARALVPAASPLVATLAPAEPIAQPLEVMIEVKLSHEESKHGVEPGDLAALIAALRECPNLNLTGLMTMPPWSDDPEQTRPYFKKLAELANLHSLANLSMGMSHDLEAAIEEGATHVRVGTALFGARPRPQ